MVDENDLFNDILLKELRKQNHCRRNNISEIAGSRNYHILFEIN